MTRKRDTLATFRKLPLFGNAGDEELASIDSVSDEVHIEAGRTLVRTGEIGREFVMVIDGEVTVERDGLEIARLGPGSHFGELALLDDHVRNATITAVTDLTVQVIDRRNFQALLQDSPSLAICLLKSTARRLIELDDEIARLRSEL